MGIYAENQGNATPRLAWCFFVALALHVIVLAIPVHRHLRPPSHRGISVSIVQPPEPIRAVLPAALVKRVPERAEIAPVQTHPGHKLKDITKPPPRPNPIPQKPKAEPIRKTGSKVLERVVKREVVDDTFTASELTGPVSTPSPETTSASPTAGRNEPAAYSQPRQAPIGKEAGEGESTGTATYAVPRYRDNPAPRYPEFAKRRGYEGKTLLSVEVLEDGTVGKIKVAESSGFDILDRAALRSVRKWRFYPGTRNGTKIRQWVMVPVRFELN